MNFTHQYSFEADVAGDVYYDGGVLEISEDNGMTWKDAMSYAGIDPGYTQVIYSSVPPPPPDAGPVDSGVTDTNPLAGRPGFAGESPGYPGSWLTTSLDFGMAFVGKTVKVRFRIGTDEGTGAPGWNVDNVSFGGPQFSSLTNAPFGAISNNSGLCTDGGTDAGTTMDAARPDAPAADVRPETGPTTDARTDGPTGDVAPPPSDAAADAPRADTTAPMDARADTTNPTTTGGGTPPADDGCDCSVPGGGAQSSGKSAAMLGLLGTLSMVLRRRRRITR